MQPYELSLTGAARAIAAGDLSPVELTESVLARASEVEGAVSAYATLTAGTARREAARAEAEIAEGRGLGPLHGIPVGIKDVIDTAGVPTSAGSLVRAGSVPDTDSTVVSALKRAGAVLTGKTHTHEFAYGVITPATRNPWDLDRVTGGSSGGSAAAVASGTALAALGTDTGGSVRIPAALTGVVGLKPTHGLVSKHGVVPLSWTLDHVGTITRTVGDAALVLDAVADRDRSVPHTPRPSAEVREREAAPGPSGTAAPNSSDGPERLDGLRIGVPVNYFFDRVDPEVARSVHAAVGVLTELGARVVDVEVPMTEYVHAAQWGIMVPEAGAYHQDTLWKSPELYGDDVRALLEAGEFVPATDYLRAQRVRGLMKQAWERLFDTVDVIAAPTVPVTATRVGQEELHWPDGSTEPVTDAFVRLCAPANLTGLPALSVPAGPDSRGLPTALQLIGRPFGEATLLRAGAAFERTRADAGATAPL